MLLSKRVDNLKQSQCRARYCSLCRPPTQEKMMFCQSSRTSFVFPISGLVAVYFLNISFLSCVVGYWLVCATVMRLLLHVCFNWKLVLIGGVRRCLFHFLHVEVNFEFLLGTTRVGQTVRHNTSRSHV